MRTIISVDEERLRILKRAMKEGMWEYRHEILITEGWKRRNAIIRFEAALDAYNRYMRSDDDMDPIDCSVNALENWWFDYQRREEI